MGLSNKSIAQAQKDPHCLRGAVYLGPGLTAWTATVWTGEAGMLAYVRSGAHKDAMKELPRICSEAATANRPWEAANLPTKAEMFSLVMARPKFIKVRKPTPDHAAGKISEGNPWLARTFKAAP